MHTLRFDRLTLAGVAGLTGAVMLFLPACSSQQTNQPAAESAMASNGAPAETRKHVSPVPDGRDILRDAAAAVRSVNTIRYEAVEDRTNGDNHDVITATIVMSRLEKASAPTRDILRAKWSVRGEHRVPDRRTTQTHAAHDGVKVRSVNHPAQKVFESTPSDDAWGRFTGMCGRLIYRELVSMDPWRLELSAPTVEYHGSKDINGAHCDVVYVHYGRGVRRATWYFSVEDHLPRGVTFRSETAGGGDIILARTVKNMVVNEPIDDAAFTLQEFDYPVVAFEPPKREPRARPALLALGDPAPAWTLKDAGGNEMSLEDFEGKVVVLDFWATWCGPCRRAMPGIQKLHEEYGDKGVVVIGISCKERAGADPAGYMESQGLTYQLLVDGTDVADAYKAQAIPTFYVIGRDGTILLAKLGATEENHQAMIDVLEAQIGNAG